MQKEPKYLVELTPTQLYELLDWYDSYIEKIEKMNINKEYIDIFKKSELASFVKETLCWIRNNKAKDVQSNPYISQADIL